jgi:hypothetical protein
MPFVKSEKQPLMAEQRQQDREEGMVEQPQSTSMRGAAAGETRVPLAAGNERTEDSDRIALAE